MPVVAARNEITRAALAIPEVTHLAWIDDDMVFTPDALMRLMGHQRLIIGGLCHSRRQPYMPTLIQGLPLGQQSDLPLSYQYDYPEGLVEVEATGAAFLVVARQVFDAIAKSGEAPWDQAGYGEDVSFCRRARAAGFNIWVDTTVKIGHVAEVVVDDAFARRNRAVLMNPWRPST